MVGVPVPPERGELSLFRQLQEPAIVAALHAATDPDLPDASKPLGRDELELLLGLLALAIETRNPEPLVSYLRDTVPPSAGSPRQRGLTAALESLIRFYPVRMHTDGERISSLIRHTLDAYHSPSDTANIAGPDVDLPERALMETALLSGDRGAARALVSELKSRGFSQMRIEVDVFEAALYDIGNRWASNEVSVAQEHLASTTASAVMVESFLQSSLPPANGRRAVLACVEGNFHVLGPNMVADALELAGWEVHRLGANTPNDTLAHYVLEVQPDMVGLSVSVVGHLAAARAAFRRLRKLEASWPMQLLVGGYVLNRHPQFVAWLDADTHVRTPLDFCPDAANC